MAPHGACGIPKRAVDEKVWLQNVGYCNEYLTWFSELSAQTLMNSRFRSLREHVVAGQRFPGTPLRPATSY